MLETGTKLSEVIEFKMRGRLCLESSELKLTN